MKHSVSIIVLAGLLACTSASFAQSSPHPLTSSRTAVAATPAQRFNLNGIWQFRANGRTFNAQFEQQGDQFKSFAGIENLGRPEALLFEGRYANGVIVGQGIAPKNTRVASTFTVEDPDHVRAGNGVVLVRISPARADDAVCDLQNSSHTQAGYAYDRAIDAVHRKLPNTLNACWLQVSANQGHARAEAVTAMIFRDGEGVPRNYATAFSWAQKSAAQGDPLGEAVLGQLYGSGLGTPRNPQLSQYWESKANTQLAALRAQQQPTARQSQSTQVSSGNQGTDDEAKILADLAEIFLGAALSPDSEPPKNVDFRDFHTLSACEAAGGRWWSIHSYEDGHDFNGDCYPK